MYRKALTLGLVVVSLSLTGFTTKPNPSLSDAGFHADKSPAILSTLEKIRQSNPTLALELSRLPEIQRGDDPAVLESIHALSQRHPDAFREAMTKMLQVGLPEHRKYCTPLQALYWLVEDGWDRAAEKIVVQYDLKRLLSMVWYSDRYVSEHPERLPMQKQRWDDMATVVDRLNSPELIDFYEKRYFRYLFYKSGNATADLIFTRKGGNCDAYAAFTILCLGNAGYNAWKLNPPGHVTVVLKNTDGKYYALDNARRIKKKQIGYLGPFDSMNDLILACGYY